MGSRWVWLKVSVWFSAHVPSGPLWPRRLNYSLHSLCLPPISSLTPTWLRLKSSESPDWLMTFRTLISCSRPLVSCPWLTCVLLSLLLPLCFVASSLRLSCLSILSDRLRALTSSLFLFLLFFLFYIFGFPIALFNYSTFSCHLVTCLSSALGV